MEYWGVEICPVHYHVVSIVSETGWRRFLALALALDWDGSGWEHRIS